MNAIRSLGSGVIDSVGGVLAGLIRQVAFWGNVASIGLAGGAALQTTVLPFILRGVNLLGIDSVMCPMPLRLEVWRRLASDMKPKMLKSIAREIPLADLPDAFRTLASGSARGRFVVNVA